MKKLFEGAQIHIFKNLAEREQCAEEYRNNKSAELRDRLIIGNIDVVFDIVRNEFTFSPLNVQDMVSEGITGLINAIDTFGKEEQNIVTGLLVNKEDLSFSEYIRVVIKETITRACEMENCRLKGLSLETLRKHEMSVNNGNLIDYRANMEYYTLKKDALNKIMAIANRLDAKSRSVVYAYYGINCTAVSKEEIAWEYNISTDHIDIIISNIEASLKAKMESETKKK